VIDGRVIVMKKYLILLSLLFFCNTAFADHKFDTAESFFDKFIKQGYKLFLHPKYYFG